MERFHFTSESASLSLQETELVNSQALYLREQLESLSLNHLPVDNEPKFRNADFFAQRRTLAYTCLSDIPIAILASSGDKKLDISPQPVSTILIVPTIEGSGMLVDDESNTLLTDSFWVCEDGSFKYIKPSRPIPVDGVNIAFDSEREDPVLNVLVKSSKELTNLAEDKKRTKEILASAGIPVPRGIFLTPEENNISEKIDAFLRTDPNMKGIALKGIYGARGDNVILFNIDEIDSLKEWAGKMIKDEITVIVEERIIPFSKIGLDHEKFGIDPTKEIDYNFRVLVTLSSSETKIIDSEIRLAEKSNNPVNISQGAKAARTETYVDSDIINQIHKVAKEATQILCQQVTRDGQDLLGFAGVDVMLDQKGNAVVIEVNCGPVGGFSTLVRLDKQPLDSIKDILIPASLPFLEKMFARRTPVKYEDLRRLPHNKNDQVDLCNSYLRNEKLHEAQTILLGLGNKYSDSAWVLPLLIKIANRLGLYDELLQYVDKRLEESPNDWNLNQAKKLVLTKLGQNDQEDTGSLMLVDRLELNWPKQFQLNKNLDKARQGYEVTPIIEFVFNLFIQDKV